MSTTREVTVWCDYPGCNQWTYGGGNNHTVLAARRGAKSEGWTYRYVCIDGEFGPSWGKDFCPKHELPRGTTDIEVTHA